jgi:hypothetical protein
LIALLTACLVTGYGSGAQATPAGWTKPYTGTNIAAFLMGAGTIGGTAQMYLQVTDTGTNTANIVGYETMTAISTGTGLFPTAVQIATGMFVYKSQTADATARPWIVIACERAFYAFIFGASTLWGTTNSTYDAQFGFGALVSYKPGDAYNCFIQGGMSASSFSSSMGSSNSIRSATGVPTSTGYYVARSFTQTGTAINASKIVPSTTSFIDVTYPFGRNAGFNYPELLTASMRMARVVSCENDGSGNNYVVQRGYLPGLWSPIHSLPQQGFETYVGNNDVAGKNFIMLTCNANSATTGYGLFETTGSWNL